MMERSSRKPKRRKQNAEMEERASGRMAGRRNGATEAQAIKPSPSAASQTLSTIVDARRRVYWVVLAAVPSSLMLGVTTHITTNIAAIPLLWVIPWPCIS